MLEFYMAKKEYDKRTFRMIDIVSRLSNSPKVSVDELCEEYNVGIRTLQKDIKELNIIFKNSIVKKDGFYRFINGFSLSNIPLQINEMIVLHSALSIFDDEDYFGEISESIKKRFLTLNINNPYFIKQRLEDITDYESVHRVLTKAIKNCYIVNIVFDHDRSLEVEPYKLTNFDGFWYLFAKDIEENKIKTYLLSKIEDVEITYKKYAQTEDIEYILKNQVHSAWFEDGIRYKVIVLVKNNIAHYFNQKKFIQSQEIIKKYENGDLKISFEVTHPEDIDNIIKSWLPDIKVIEPKWYKKQIIKELEEYLVFINKS